MNIHRIIGKLRISVKLIKEVKNWPTVFLNYLGILRQEKISYSFRNGKKFFLQNIRGEEDTSGIATVYEIFIMKNYTPSFMQIKPKDTIVDIGANMGVFSIYASLTSKDTQVYSYEALKGHFNRMQKNIQINAFKNITLHNAAVAGKKGKKKLFINENCSGGHSLVFDRDSKKSVTVNCVTLQNIFEENKIKKIDFLKIDCEGAEYEILYNTPKKYLDRIQKIALEYENFNEKGCNSADLKRFLEKNGFKVILRGSEEKEGILYALKNT